MRVAVLMSTYNGEKYLRDQIESILNLERDFTIDLWIRDDGSTDNTLSILEQYEKENKINWYRGKNLGPAKSFIDLLYKCQGYDYYAFSDQDDYWNKDKIVAGISMIVDEKGPTLYCSNAILVNHNLDKLGKVAYKSIPHIDLYTVICASNVLGCTIIFNNELAEVLRGRDKPQIIGMHDAYIARVCVSVGGKIIYDANSHLLYRQHENNTIGVKTNLAGKVRQRLEMLLQEKKPSITMEAEELLSLYSDLMTDQSRVWIKKVASYKKSIFSRMQLAFSVKTRYTSRKIALRLSFLLGKR